MFEGAFPASDEVVTLVISPHAFIAGAGATLLLVNRALAHFGFGKEPGLGQDAHGHASAHLVPLLGSLLRHAGTPLLTAGLTGMGGTFAQQPVATTAVAAVLAGLVAFLLGYGLPGTLSRWNAQAARLPAVVGQLCIVVETIPAQQAGFGKVRARAGGKAGCFLAQSTGDELSEGLRVRIVELLEEERVQVAPE